MITEIVTFTLAPSHSLSSPTSPARQTIRDFLSKELAAEGAHEAYFGAFDEKPDKVILLVEWDSVEAHQGFLKSTSHPSPLTPILAPSTTPTTIHVPFASSPAPALGANPAVTTTEVVFFYFPAALTPAQRAAVMASVEKMRPVIEASEAMGIYDGWALESDVVNPVAVAAEGEEKEKEKEEEREREPCQVFVNLVGWESVNAHGRFQASEAFGRNIHHLLGIGEVRGMEILHVALERVGE